VLLVLVKYVLPLVRPEAVLYAMMGGFILALVILLWWLLFSRAPWVERLGVLVVMAIALFATLRLAHVSLRNAILVLQALPALSLALVAVASITRRRTAGARRMSMAAVILLVCAAFTLVRTSGVRMNGVGWEPTWRWTQTPEERLLAGAADEPTPA